jgi:hypothetical protein
MLGLVMTLQDDVHASQAMADIIIVLNEMYDVDVNIEKYQVTSCK